MTDPTPGQPLKIQLGDDWEATLTAIVGPDGTLHRVSSGRPPEVHAKGRGGYDATAALAAGARVVHGGVGGGGGSEPARPGDVVVEPPGAALAEPPNPNTCVQVVHLSREELEQQKETLLGVLQVFELYTRSEIEEQLAEVEYLLGGES